MLNEQLLQILSPVTEEEQPLLDGQKINLELYSNFDSTIRADKMMRAGNMISLRAHPRFAPFPSHCHDYVELVYMCSGQSTHVINGNRLTLQTGELLLLAQRTTQEILYTGSNDIAVNFIILPAFFEQVLTLMGEKDAPLRRFLMDCLCGGQSDIPYLHFKVADVLPIQNLIENLLISFLSSQTSGHQLRQNTMGLLFLHLLEQTEHLTAPQGEQTILLDIYRYIETHYQNGSLGELAETLHFDVAVLSRKIKKLSQKTYTELVQEKRLSHAAFLLKNTSRKISDIALSVGYDNISYFHRLFAAQFGVSPRTYRMKDEKVK